MSSYGPVVYIYTFIYSIISLRGWEIPKLQSFGASGVHGYARDRTSIFMYVSAYGCSAYLL